MRVGTLAVRRQRHRCLLKCSRYSCSKLRIELKKRLFDGDGTVSCEANPSPALKSTLLSGIKAELAANKRRHISQDYDSGTRKDLSARISCHGGRRVRRQMYMGIDRQFTITINECDPKTFAQIDCVSVNHHLKR
jgi:hypothetical protein